MSLQNPFGMHRQSVWYERAQDGDYPLWQRVGWLAMGSHRGNGHANFIMYERELALLLGKEGEAVPPNRLSEAISKAKLKGLLAIESNARCLVVPPHAIEGGLGHVRERCAVHVGRRAGLR